MKKTFLRIFLPILIVIALATAVTVVAVATSAGDEEKVDAMIAIRADEELESKLLNTYSLADDGYLGIPVDFAIYHDKSFPVDAGFNGTSLIMYVVNTYATRTGTDSDVEIIKSMLDRGYIVVVTDYHNHKKTTTPDLDWAAQTLNTSIRAGKYFTDSEYKQDYGESFIVPAGHNLERDRVYWEIDKHSADGTLERIVDVWNNDFRGVKGEKYVIPWHNDGVRKEVQNGIHDGSEPVWYSIGEGEGQITVRGVTYVPDPENGLYVYVKHTKANEITDCVKPDGSPIDLNLYMHIIYPTNPENEVPVMTMASSSEHLASADVNGERPHANGFGFDGYGVVMYDYGYSPMARKDHYYYFDGSSIDDGSVTGDNTTYSIEVYNSSYILTAAMRYIRYLALTEPETFSFNGTVGVIGNSKASIVLFVADKELGYVKSTNDGYTEEELTDYADQYIGSFGKRYYLYGHSGETRFDAGQTSGYEKNGALIEGGERQPWLTYNGAMIPSNAQFVYSSCGGYTDVVDENFGPFMTSGHIGIETTGYGGNNGLFNRARVYDLPFLGFEVVLGHTFIQRECFELNIDPYIGYKEFAHYFLSDAAPTVIYATPLPNGEIGTDAVFTVKFAGIVSASEIAKVTVTDEDGNLVLGVWESAYGKTEWTFTPTLPLEGNKAYTLNVPASVKAENGKELQAAYTATYYAEPAENTTLTDTDVTVSSTSGSGFTLTVPDLGAYAADGYNRAYIYFSVTSDAANTIRLYKDNEGDTLLGEVPIDGIGVYAVDITDLLFTEAPGTTVTLYFRAGKTTAVATPTGAKLGFEDFEDGAHPFSFGKQAKKELIDVGGEHGKVLSVAMTYTTSSRLPSHRFYRQETALSISSMLPTMGAMDLGRRFTLTFDIYDETSRMIAVGVGSLSSSKTGLIDYHADTKNFSTKAGEWVSVTLEFDLQDALYGKSAYEAKELSISLATTGATELPVYFDNFRLSETTTDVTVGAVSLSITTAGGDGYKAVTNEEEPFLVGSTAYATLSEAVAALGKTDGTVTLQSNVTFTDSVSLTDIAAESFTLDLNGYQIRSTAQNASAIVLNTSAVKYVSVKNGGIYLYGGSLIGFGTNKTATDVTVTMQNVYIGAERFATVQSFLVNTTASATAKLKLILDECEIDLRERRFTKNPVKMLPSSTDKVSISTVLKGGVIYLSRVQAEKISLAESMESMYFEKGANGFTVFMLALPRELEEMTLLIPEGFAITEAAEQIEAPVGYRAYAPVFSKSASSPYGIVPENYRDTELYPFVLFNRETNEFLGASDTLITDSGSTAILNKLNKKTGSYAVYVRGDVSHANGSYNISSLNSDVLIDLNGYTLTYTKGITAQAKAAGNHPRVTFKNGTILANTTSPFISTASLKASMAFSFTFEDVTFKVAEGMKPSVLIHKTSTAWATEGKDFSVTVTVKDCVFDMTDFTEKTTLFNIGNPNGRITDNVTLIGGNILGDASMLSLYDLGGTENCSFTIEKGADGNYITNTRPTDADVPSAVINTPEGAMLFTKAISESDGMTTYALEPDPLETPYGSIPKEYADPEAYPILLFNSTSRKVIWAGSKWGGETSSSSGTVGGVLEQMYKNCDKGVLVIYLQADITITSGYNNHGNTGGTHIIDLNGHTVTLGTYFMRAQAKKKEENRIANFTIKNGTINAGNNALVNVGSNNNTTDAIYGMTATYLFENIRITSCSGSLVTDSLGGNYQTTTNVILRNCDITLTEGRGTTPLFLLGATSSAKTHTVNVILEGGCITTPDASFPTLLQIKYTTMTNKSLGFACSENGYTKLVTGKMSTFSDNVVRATENGERMFILDTSTDTQTTYSLAYKSAYGYIPESYTNAEKYPFLIFNKDTGKLVKGVSIFSDETIESALGYVQKKSGNFVILLQCDHVTSGSTNYNFTQQSGELLFDLGGHAISISNSLYYAQAKSNHDELTVTTINGTIVLTEEDSTLLPLGSNIHATGNKKMNYIFNNVVFRVENAAAVLVSDASASGTMDADVIFNGCTFITPSKMNSTLFKLGVNNEECPIHIQVNGGTFRINTTTKLPIYQNVKGYENQTVSFGKYNGAYPTVTAPVRLDLTTVSFVGDSELLGLRKLGTEGENITYTMTPFSFVSAYLNITSELNLVYRAYLPFSYENPTVTFTIGTITRTVEAFGADENGLYLFKLPSITPAMMGETVSATLTATLDGERVSIVHDTLSVKSYLEALKAENEGNEALADLVGKLLVYGAAAQQYVGADSEDFVCEIGDLSEIPEEENVITMTGTASDLASFSKLSLSLDGSYELRLKIALASTEGLSLKVTKGSASETVDLDTYEIKDGMITVVIDDIYANELGEEISFVLMQNGTEIGKTLTVSVNAYLYRASNGADERLTTLAKALYAYGEAAKEYATN